MTKMEMIRRLIELQSSEFGSNTEQAHIEADNILCELLSLMKQDDVVHEYRKINKWYS